MIDEEGERGVVAVCLVALYLRGAPRRSRPPRVRAAAIAGWLRRECASLAGAESALRRAGCWEEAIAVAEPGLLAWAEQVYAEGHAITYEDDAYPDGWRQDRLGVGAPAVWVRRSPFIGSSGLAWASSRRAIAIVGSRSIAADDERWVQAATREAIRLGAPIVSGGAPGCDRCAAASALSTHGEFARVVIIAPCGLARLEEFLSWGAPSQDPTLAAFLGGDVRVAFVSAQAPEEGFSRAAAMERNALIYAFGAGAVVAHARYREGGTWHGAIDALRRRHRLVVRAPDPDASSTGAPPGFVEASRALIALGAMRADSPESAVRSLFGGAPGGSLTAPASPSLAFDDAPTVWPSAPIRVGGKYNLAS